MRRLKPRTRAKEGGNDQVVLRVKAAVEVTKAEQDLLMQTARITAEQGAAKLEQVKTSPSPSRVRVRIESESCVRAARHPSPTFV
jgi:hypothetical protein